jgi:hypothetical protein
LLVLPKKKAGAIPIVFFLIFLLIAGIFALTQEADEESVSETTEDFINDSSALVDTEPAEASANAGANAVADAADFYAGEAEEQYFEFVSFGPPRWFRSNSGGMALEEIPSRLSALRNEYTLVIDYLPPDELEIYLEPFFKENYVIETRVLYNMGEEYRRQWIFRDGTGNTRLNAVIRLIEKETDPTDPDEDTVTQTEVALDEANPADAVTGGSALALNTEVLLGFIEIYSEDGRIIEDYRFTEDTEEIFTEYFYENNILIRSETQMRLLGNTLPGGIYRKIYTDHYRYNRSSSLRNMERIYHEYTDNEYIDVEPVRFLFPARILDAVYDKDFLKENLAVTSTFIDSDFIDENYQMVSETDIRGRVLSQTLYDRNNNVVWILEVAWAGDRVTAMQKTEGDNVKLTEYEYNSVGDRIVLRDINNGVLERLVYIDGERETEELYMNEVLVLVAFWEDGRKIHEQRVRR